MDKVAYKNKFRILDANNQIVRINSSTDRNGVEKYIEGFESEAEAKGALALYCIGASDGNANDYTIETYPESYSIVVPISKNEQLNKGLAKLKIFNGKGLKYNTDYHQRKADNKYRPEKYYTKEVWLAQSVERNKGISLISKKGDSRKFKNRGVEDMETSMKVERLLGARSNVPESYLDHLVESLCKQHFDSAQDLKKHLRAKGFSARWANKIFSKVYKTKNLLK